MAYDGDDFRPIDSRLYQQPAGRRPYDTWTLNEVNNDQRWVCINRGSHVSHGLGGSGYGTDGTANTVHNRPYASVNERFQSYFRIPFYLEAGVEAITVRWHYRLGHGKNDLELDPTILSGLFVESRVSLPFSGLESIGAFLPLVNSGTGGSDWTHIDQELNTTAIRDDILESRLDMLTLEIKASPDLRFLVPGAGVSGPFSGADMSDWAANIAPNTWFANDAAVNSPEPDSTWLTCTEINDINAFQLSTFHDHVFQMPNAPAGSTCVLYPRPDWSSIPSVTANLRWVPYIQIRSIEVETRFAP